MTGEVSAESIAEEFPGWEAWQGIEGLWHARIVGRTPPVIVTGEDPQDLRDEIKRRVSKSEAWS